MRVPPALTRAEQDEQDLCAVTRGEGDRAFASGRCIAGLDATRAGQSTEQGIARANLETPCAIERPAGVLTLGHQRGKFRVTQSGLRQAGEITRRGVMFRRIVAASVDEFCLMQHEFRSPVIHRRHEFALITRQCIGQGTTRIVG